MFVHYAERPSHQIPNNFTLFFSEPLLINCPSHLTVSKLTQILGIWQLSSSIRNCRTLSSDNFIKKVSLSHKVTHRYSDKPGTEKVFDNGSPLSDKYHCIRTHWNLSVVDSLIEVRSSAVSLVNGTKVSIQIEILCTPTFTLSQSRGIIP
jgi:hypothetical protein